MLQNLALRKDTGQICIITIINMNRVMKLRSIGWVGRVARMKEYMQSFVLKI